MTTPLEGALAYALLGWPVFPLHGISASGACTCGVADCGDAGKHPRIKAWTTEASTDTDVVRRWWGRWPEASVAIVTGQRSGVVAVDLDGDDVGGEAYGWLLHKHGAPGSAQRPDGASIRTGRDEGGWRLLFALPPGVRIRKGVLAPGVEFMGDGASAIMPPSMHKTGRRYVWRDEIPYGGLPTLAPAWVDLMRARPPAPLKASPRPVDFDGLGTPYGQAALRGELERLAGAEPGTRNDTLNSCAFAVGSLSAAGHLDLERATAELVRVALEIGLGEQEIRATLDSGLGAGLANPRREKAV